MQRAPPRWTARPGRPASRTSDVQPDRTRYEFFHDVHETLAMSLLVIAVLHAAAAIKHHFIDRDDILRRMLPVRLRSDKEQP